MKVFRVNLVWFNEGIDSLSMKLFTNQSDAEEYKAQLESNIKSVYDEVELIEMNIE